MKTKNIKNIDFLYENGYFYFFSTDIHKELLLNKKYIPLNFVEEKTQLIDTSNLPHYLTRIVHLDDSKKNYILEFYKLTLLDFVNNVLHLEKIEECDSNKSASITLDILKSFTQNNENSFDFNNYEIKHIPLFLYNLLKNSTTKNLMEDSSKETIKIYNENLKLLEELDFFKSSYETAEDLNMLIINFCANYLPKGIDSFEEEFSNWYSKNTLIN